MGQFITVDECKREDFEWSSTLRLKVIINIQKPLFVRFFVPKEENRRDWINVKYERLPTFCYACGIIGHIAKLCNNKALLEEGCSRNQNKPRFGPWLHAKTPLSTSLFDKPRIPFVSPILDLFEESLETLHNFQNLLPLVPFRFASTVQSIP